MGRETLILQVCHTIGWFGLLCAAVGEASTYWLQELPAATGPFACLFDDAECTQKQSRSTLDVHNN